MTLSKHLVLLLWQVCTAGWEEYQSADMGHSRAGTLQGHSCCVCTTVECRLIKNG